MAKKKAKPKPTRSAPPAPKPPSAGSSPADSSRTIIGLLTGIAVIAAIHLAASFIPALRTWGIDYWSELPVVWRFVLVGIIAISFVPAVGLAVDRAVGSVARTKAASIGALIVLGVLFYVFRSHGYSYGDSYSFLSYYRDTGVLPALSGQLKTQVLDLVAHWALFRYALMPMGGSVAQSYAILGAVGGVFAVWAIVRIANALANDHSARRLIIASALTSSAVILFFGHAESYTLTNVAFLWALAFALKARHKPKLIWLGWGMYVLAVLFHQLAVAALPVMVWAHWRRTENRPLWSGNAKIVMTFIGGFIAWLVAAYVYRVIREPIFVPLAANHDSAYTAFSLYHLVDTVNLLFFLAPMGVIGLVIWFVTKPRENPRAGHLLIAIAAAATWYFTFWVDPLIGAFRDWDLFAGFAIPLSIWAGSAIALRFSKEQPPAWLWVPVAALGIAHAGGFVATTQNEMAVAERIDRMVDEDIHYSGRFFNGSRLLPWAVVLRNELGRNDLAIRHLHRYAEISPRQPMAWWNLCRSYRELGMLDSALSAVERAVALAPQTPIFLQTALQLRYQTGDAEGVRPMLEQIVAAQDTSYTPRVMLGNVYRQLGRYADARRTLEGARQLHPDEHEAYYMLGRVDEATGDTANAIANFETAIQHGAQGDEIFQSLLALYQRTGRLQDALNISGRWEQAEPNSANAAYMRGTSFYLNNQFDSAKTILERARSLDSTSALTVSYLASTERHLGHPDRAKELAERAAQLDNRLALPYLELVHLAADANNNEAAIQATREYLRRAPQDSGMAYLQPFILK